MKRKLFFLAAMTAIGMNLNAETVTDVKYIDAQGKEQTCAEATVVATGPDGTWNAGWYVVKGTDIQLVFGAICNGEVHLILADGAKLTATGGGTDAGIRSSSDQSSLSIYGQANQTGKLIAKGGSTGGAGIGGKNSQPGMNITINGGVIEATGGGNSSATGYAAGIGGAGGKSGSNITINGGKVTAISSGNGASAIGAGAEGTGSNIFVNPALILKADNNNPPTTEIAHASIATDVASSLAGKQYATIEPKTPIVGNEFTVDGINYVVTSIAPFEAQVADNSSYAGNPALVIPNSVEYKDTKLAVTVIASNAFKDNANITSVVIPGTVDTIGQYAFYNCASLKVAKLNEGVKYLRETSFNRTYLDSIFFPASLTNFTGDLSKIMETTDVKWYEVADGNAEASSMDGVLFNANANILLYFPVASERSEYAVPAGVDTIANFAVSMDTNLVSIKMPDVVVLGDGAFSDCSKLASLEFSDAIDSICRYAFTSDTMLTTITCPAVVPPALDKLVFADVTLSNITLYVPAESVSAYQAADTWKDMNVQPIPETAFEQVEGQKSADAKVESQKYMREGQLIIERNKVRYNAQGQVVE